MSSSTSANVNNEDGGCPATIVFSPSLTRRLSDERFPPTYVGVRRVRPPSSQQQQDEVKKKPIRTAAAPVAVPVGTAQPVTQHNIDNDINDADADAVVVKYTVIDEETGIERRMNSQEKKRLKLELRKKKAEQKRRQRQQQRQQQQQHQQQQKQGSNSKKRKQPEELSSQRPETDSVEEKDDEDLELAVDPTASKIEQNDDDDDESSDRVRRERDGDVLPVALSSALTRQALLEGRSLRVAPKNNICATTNTNDDIIIRPHSVVMDDDLSCKWATELRQSMLPAEEIRHREDLRPLPYILQPEVWKRNRPPVLGDTRSNREETNGNDVGGQHPMVSGASRPNDDSADGRDWAFCRIHPVGSVPDNCRVDHEVVIQLLHFGTNIHISCGAKFGCDYLLYDGPRQDCHAFAGLRVLHCRQNSRDLSSVPAALPQLPIPSTYDMTAYVRCLNTAGKLALVATVVREDDEDATKGSTSYRVAIVDLALEKVVVGRPRNTRKNKNKK